MITDITQSKRNNEHISALNASLEQRVQERSTALEHALADLQEQRSFQHQITESMREGVVVYDAAGIVEYANPFISEITGIPLDRIIGSQEPLSALAAEPALVREYLLARAADIESDCEVAMSSAGGEARYVRILATPRLHEGTFAGGIAVVSDLTQRHRTEAARRTTSERLAVANRALARAARLKDEFLAGISHELRTPLTGILALTEALLTDSYGAVTAAQRYPMEMMDESGRHLLNLINDVLDVAKAEAGKLDLRVEPLAIEDLCRASLRAVRNVAESKGQHLSYTIAPAGLKMEADPLRLKQILVNLLSNAVKFTPEGGNLGLRVAGDLGQNIVVFSVWDTGSGIAEDQLTRIFDPFVQMESDLNRSSDGSGLGLALVLRLAALHGGTIRVDSTVGQGSEFHLTLPWTTPVALNQPFDDQPARAWIDEHAGGSTAHE